MPSVAPLGQAGTHHYGDRNVDLLILVGQRQADPRIHQPEHKVDDCGRESEGTKWKLCGEQLGGLAGGAGRAALHATTQLCSSQALPKVGCTPVNNSLPVPTLQPCSPAITSVALQAVGRPHQTYAARCRNPASRSRRLCGAVLPDAGGAGPTGTLGWLVPLPLCVSCSAAAPRAASASPAPPEPCLLISESSVSSATDTSGVSLLGVEASWEKGGDAGWGTPGSGGALPLPAAAKACIPDVLPAAILMRCTS